MNCEECGKLIYAYIDGDLSSELKGAVESHLETCERCKEEYTSLRALVISLDEIKLPDIPEGFVERTLPRLSVVFNLSQPPKFSFKSFWLIAGSVLFGALIVVLFFLGKMPDTQSMDLVSKLLNVFSGDSSSWWVFLSTFAQVLIKNPYYVIIIALFISWLSFLGFKRKFAEDS